MPEIAITITNLPEIKRAFAQAPALMTKELNKAIQRTILEIGRDSRRVTPVDTGRLRASTYEQFSNLKGEVGTKTEYDVFVHEGTRFMRARPYLRSAVEKNTANTDENFTKAVQNVLDKIGEET